MTRRALTATAVLTLLASAASAVVVSETWGGKGKSFAHPDTLAVSAAGGAVLASRG